MNTRTFLKTLCLVPIGAVVEKLPGKGVGQVAEPMMEMPRGFIPPKKLVQCTAVDETSGRYFLWYEDEHGNYRILYHK